MYCKLFASLYQGTLRGASHEILVFTNLLAHAGRDGVVDKHFRAIAEETGLNIDEVKTAITNLEAPDPESRSPDELGARIVRMDEHRVWGWRVVNYGKYRAIRSEEDRAEQNRLSQQRWRNKHKPASATVSHDKPQSAQGEGEGEAIRKKSTPSGTPEGSFIDSLKALSAYKGIDIDRELSKMEAWLLTPKGKGRKLTKGFVVNWLNRLDAQIATPNQPKSKADKLWDEMQAMRKAKENE